MLTREMAREVWSGTGARIADLSLADLAALRGAAPREPDQGDGASAPSTSR